MKTSWTEAELAYFAGIIDGEGCISICGGTKTRKAYFGTQLFIGNTDERLIHWVHQRFGGSIGFRKRLKPNQKDLWFVNFCGTAIEPVLSAAMPYLVLKREQAALMLEFRALIRSVGANTPTAEQLLEQRAAMKGRMSVLNYRGVA